nr:MAG TPA: hypothetical protein [Caudoviricetes sp.]
MYNILFKSSEHYLCHVYSIIFVTYCQYKKHPTSQNEK